MSPQEAGVARDDCSQLPDLRQRILFTLVVLASYRVGVSIPLPGVDGQSIFALGLTPYIVATSLVYALTLMVPSLVRLRRDGEAGRRRITQRIRFVSVALAMIASAALAHTASSWGIALVTMVTLPAGAALVMWLGEQISDRGIGSGMSLILMTGLLSTPDLSGFREWNPFFAALVLVGVAALAIALERSVVLIPVRYTKRVVGRWVVDPGVPTMLPLRANPAGSLPLVFTQTLLPMTPLSLALAPCLSLGYILMVFRPVEAAENIQKYGGLVLGVEPGKATADLLYGSLTKLGVASSMALATLSLVPTPGVSAASLVIVVLVMLDTLRYVEAHLRMPPPPPDGPLAPVRAGKNPPRPLVGRATGATWYANRLRPQLSRR